MTATVTMPISVILKESLHTVPMLRSLTLECSPRPSHIPRICVLEFSCIKLEGIFFQQDVV